MATLNDNQELLYFNGIDGDSGEYDLPPMTGQELAGFIQGELPPENLNELRYRYHQATVKTMGVKEGVNPLKIDECGWGIIFPAGGDPAAQAAMQEALKELLDLRRGQAGEHFKIYAGADGYRPDETKTDFLARWGAGPGPADPDKVPYYLLIAGSPEQIPYTFQSQLDVQYAVGRIAFETVQEYANYAHTVATAESGQVRLRRQAAFWGTANPDDQATHLSAQNLVSPLLERLRADPRGWELQGYLSEQATKAQLKRLLGGDQTPAVLFTGSHGMSFSLNSPRQVTQQGALLCQDWPGPQAWRGKGAIPQDYYFAGDDLGAEANLLGMVAFFFACYGAGTPLNDEFSKQAFKQRTAIAAKPFVARLPSRLLAQGGGGALAVVGHVERAWSYSFMWDKAGAQTTVFESSLRRLLNGYPVGAAFEFFNERYAELSTVLSDELEEVEYGKKSDPYELAGLWTANNDARGYTIIGDPAVRLPLGPAGDPGADRPALEAIQLTSPAAAHPSAAAALPGTAAAQPGETAADEPVPAAALPGAAAGLPKPAEAQAGQAPAQKGGDTPPPQGETAGQPLVNSMAVNYGLLDSLAEARDRLTASLQSFAESLGKAMVKAVDDAATLEVSTYVGGDLAAAKNDLSGAKLRAFTRIRVDGDTEVLVPEQAGQIDRALWEIHLSMVQQAQANRNEVMKAAAAAATGLLQALKVL